MDVIETERFRSRSDRLGTILGCILLAVVLLHGTQASLAVFTGEHGQGANLWITDVLLGVAFVLWLVRRIRRIDLTWPPISFSAMLGTLWLFLSLFPFLKGSAAEGLDVSFRQGAVKVVQFAEYFLFGVLVFGDVFRDDRWRRWAVRALIVSVSAAVLCGLIQYAASTPVTLVRGTGFENRHTFGAFLALTIPVLYGVGIVDVRSWLGKAALGLLMVLAFCVCLTGGAFLAICIGLLTVAAFRGWFRFGFTAVVLLFVGLVLLPMLPRANNDVLLDSVLLYRETDPYGSIHDNIIEEKIAPALDNKMAALREKIAQGNWSQGDLPDEDDYVWKWRQGYLEWQAALRMMEISPWFGVGAGSYQQNVNDFYDMPKYAENLLEPNTLSGYMVWGATAGIPFLFIVFWMVANGARTAAGAYRREKPYPGRGLALGLLGSFAALAVLTVFTNPLVRGVGMTVALLLGLAWAAAHSKGPWNSAQTPTESEARE